MTTRPWREPCPGVGYRAGGQEPRSPYRGSTTRGSLFSSARRSGFFRSPLHTSGVQGSVLVRVLAVLVLLLVAGTAAGVVLLWPENREIPRPPELGAAPDTEKAEIVGVRSTACGLGAGRDDCLEVTAELRSGPDEGEEVTFTFAAAEGEFDVGDDIRVFKNAPLDAPPDPLTEGIEIEPYSFSDFERRTPMLGLVVMFVALVLLTGRWQGFRALLGLCGSLAVIVFFIVPAILDGRSPIAVAFVGALAIMLITLPLAHGAGPKTIAASLGTAASLTLTLVLGYFFIDLTHLSGVSSEEAVYLRATQGDLSLRGLLLAGMVIAALGVLDDLTVSQSSTVMALRRANPSLGFGGLFRSAVTVGHDHIAATVNTLVLAYAGASLPVLLIFSLADTPFADAINFEAVAETVVATLVGSIGLIAAVPITTALAALLASSVEPEALSEVGHAH